MKMKVSDYIAEFFAKKGITHVFGVVGGGAMHLNDSFGHHPQMHCTYNHHEQASAMAAEAYARIAGKPAIVCVTSGPGAINALNGVAGAYQDSIPMLIVSGQMKTANLVRTSGLDLRTLGGQEFDITHAVGDMTKYAELVLDPQRIAFVLEKAYAIATTGRQGPCWVDVPVDIQGKSIETDDLQHYRLPVYPEADYTKLAASVADGLMHAERPVIYAGNGIRWAGAAELLPALAKRYGASVVTCWDSIDLMATDIKVTTIQPGMVETPFSEVRFHGDKARAANVYKGIEALTPEDIADTIAYVVDTPRRMQVSDVVILANQQGTGFLAHKE